MGFCIFMQVLYQMAIIMNFGTDIKFLKGVGSTRAEAFYKLGISTVGALLRYYPRNYEDWSNILSIKDAPLGEN
ncbi:MAG: hypothetical protein RR239_07470, partial [Oscillospiraceae bacterium]